MKNPYEILGLDENSSFEELEQRYNQLKAEYSEGRFKSGAEGAEAARKLTELESAWQDIKSRQAVAEAVDGGRAGDFAYVDKLIKEQKYDEAQAVLDSMTVREGEWHYFQSIIYYKREWLSECKKQLEAAIACDPNNFKYKTALEKLNMVIGNANVDPRTLGKDNINQEQMQMQQQGDMLSNCCLAYCLTSLCCDCTRCCM